MKYVYSVYAAYGGGYELFTSRKKAESHRRKVIRKCPWLKGLMYIKQIEVK